MSIGISINGKKEILENEMSILELLRKKNIRPEVVTVELNEKIIERKDYQTIILKESDMLELVYFMGGGGMSDKLVAENVLELIGNTPMVKLRKIAGGEMAEIYAKLEHLVLLQMLSANVIYTHIWNKGFAPRLRFSAGKF